MAWMRLLLALVALIGAVAHVPSMASAPLQVAANQAVAASDCHSKAASTEKATPDKPKPAACCPTGCKGDCTMIGAFFASPPARKALAFLRAALEAPLRAAPVTSHTLALERPPKKLG